jgi:hypothetical protein
VGVGDILNISIFEAAPGRTVHTASAGARPGNFVDLPPQAVELLALVARAGGPKFQAIESYVTLQRSGKQVRGLLSRIVHDRAKIFSFARMMLFSSVMKPRPSRLYGY